MWSDLTLNLGVKESGIGCSLASLVYMIRYQVHGSNIDYIPYLLDDYDVEDIMKDM